MATRPTNSNDSARLLERLAREADLLGAHHAEFIPEGHPSGKVAYAALRAAVSYGCAIGLRRAAELIAEAADAAGG